jgi:hypothetical protein
MSFDWILTFFIGFIGLALASVGSTRVVDFMVFVYVFNRGVRRVVDFYVHHEFNPLSPISLAPLLVAAAMLLVALIRMDRLPGKVRMILWGLGAAAVYAFAIGFVNVRFAAVYALAEGLAPLGMFAFVLVVQPENGVKDRWIRSFSWAAILVSAYGWYQYLTIPEWDKFWLIETKMYGYMGIPEPTQMTVFSTMAERGVLAGFLGLGVVPMIVSKAWRPLPGLLGWAGVVLVFSVILLTLSRGGLLFAAIGTIAYLLVNRGRGAKQVAFAIAVLGIAGWFGIERIPNAERVTKRFESLGEMEEDGSFKGRVEIMSGGLGAVLQQPFGHGLGSAGALAARVNASSARPGITPDSGWFIIFLVYGIPGTALLLVALVSAWRLLNRRFRQPELRDRHVLLARCMLISLLPCCFAGDLLTGYSILWLALGCGISLPPRFARSVVIERSPAVRGSAGAGRPGGAGSGPVPGPGWEVLRREGREAE